MLSLEWEAVWTGSLWRRCTSDKSWKILNVFWIKAVRIFLNIFHTNEICTIGIYYQKPFKPSRPSFAYGLMKISFSNTIAVRAAKLQEVWHQEIVPWWKSLWNCIRRKQWFGGRNHSFENQLPWLLFWGLFSYSWGYRSENQVLLISRTWFVSACQDFGFAKPCHWCS